MKFYITVLSAILLTSPGLSAQTDNTKTTDQEVYMMVNIVENASFVGGETEMLRFISDSLVFPKEYLQSADSVKVKEMLHGNGIKIMVEFVVKSDSTLTSVKALNNNGTEYLQPFVREAIALVEKMDGHWLPAKQRDQKVSQRLRLPIVFRL